MINPELFGISFSAKQCRNFGLDPKETLDWLIAQGWRRFRLMSYWNEHEKEQGTYNFSELDWQIDRIKKAGGIITLCLGVKQPRWPEYHWPKWTHVLNNKQRRDALLMYTQKTVERYKNETAIVSYQLENEALLKGFGEHIAIDRTRLQQEYKLVQRLDPTRPIIMSTSNGWGIPVRSPRPNIVGFSNYFVMHQKGKYHGTIQRPWLHRARKILIRTALRKPVFIHELQCEPWGPTAIWKMDIDEQDKSMSPKQIAHNIRATRSIKAAPIDLWGSEWWFWRYKQGDPTIWNAVRSNVS